MVQLIKEKKKERQKVKDEADAMASNAAASGGQQRYTQEELEKLQYQLKEAETEKVIEEKKLKHQIQQ